jgi:glucose-1-phosphate adenylyltransferase
MADGKAKKSGRASLGEVASIVLGGGRGSRLHPLTALRAKPAVPLMGRYRLIDIPLSNCIHSGLNKIFVLTQFNSASLNRHINSSYKFDTFSGGFVEILAAEQTIESGDWFQGTADAVRKQLRHIHNIPVDQYLILSGDQLYRMDYGTMLETHARKNADITVAALPVDKQAAKSFGIMRVTKGGRINQFVEKPRTEKDFKGLSTPPNLFDEHEIEAKGRPYLASMGVYVFKASVLDEILENRRDWIDFGRDVIPNSLRDRKVYAHLFHGFWEDIGTVRSYYQVHMDMVVPNPPFQFYDPSHVIYTHPRYLPGSHVYSTTIDNSMIAEGCRITQSTIDHSIIGIRSIIRPGTKVERSIVMGADYYEGEVFDQDKSDIPIGIGKKCLIRQAIIDKNARIGNNVVIRGSDTLADTENAQYVVRDGIVVVLKGAEIPDGTRIE